MNTMAAQNLKAVQAHSFRQHAQVRVTTGVDRHWTLDNKNWRELLKMAATRIDPKAPLQLFGDRASDDQYLDVAIDRLGLRNLPKPVTAMQSLSMDVKFLAFSIKVLVAGV